MYSGTISDICIYILTVFADANSSCFTGNPHEWKHPIGVPLRPRVTTSMFSSHSCQRACDYRIKSSWQPHIRNRDILHFFELDGQSQNNCWFIIVFVWMFCCWILMFEVCFTHLPSSQEGYKYSTQRSLPLLQQWKPLRSLWPTLKARIVPINWSKCPYKKLSLMKRLCIWKLKMVNILAVIL